MLAQANKMKHCRFYHRHSLNVKKPVQGDIVVSETLGNFAFEEHIIETMNDARRRFLKEGGTIIPFKVRQFVCPVISDRLHREIDTWGEVGFDLELSAAREMGFNNIYVRTIGKEDLLTGEGAVQMFDEVDFRRENASRRQWNVQWKMPQEASVYGFAVWWEAELVPDVILSTSPLSKPTHWEQIFVPLRESLTAKEGDVVSFSMTCDTGEGLSIAWETSLFRAGQKISSIAPQDISRGQTD
jgi:protein arginine N-methyltransferase 1